MNISQWSSIITIVISLTGAILMFINNRTEVAAIFIILVITGLGTLNLKSNKANR